MHVKERILAFFINTKPYLLRVLHLAFIFSFLLPFADVRGCSSPKIKFVYGYDVVLKEYGGLLYLVPIGIFAAYFIFSFIKRNYSGSLGAFAASWRALGAGLSGLFIWYMPQLQFLFDTVTYRIGYFLSLLCAAAVFCEGIVVSLASFLALRKSRPPRGPEGRFLTLMRYHYAIAIFSVLLVPVYFFNTYPGLLLPFFFLLFLSLPFVLSQFLVIEGVRREEKWTGRWAIAVSILALAVLALVIVSFL